MKTRIQTLLLRFAWLLGGGTVALCGWFVLPPLLAQDAPKPPAVAAPKPEPNWIVGSEEEKLAQIARHLRGLDLAMIETGYRYAELYWAGQDRNWDFAAYQLDKIRLTTELALERRPKRATSAQAFLIAGVPQMKEAITAKDPALFEERFAAFTVQCNACHTLEKVEFMQVTPPTVRGSPIRFTAPQVP
jgi:mono/diheme cytochrome c family protein